MRMLIAGVLMLGLTSPALAQIGQGGGPIDITAKRSELLETEGIWRWYGDVRVTQGGSQLLAQQMDVFLSIGPDGQVGDIQRIEAEGEVAYITETDIGRADRGVYRAENGLIELIGNISVRRGPPPGNTFTCGKLFYDPNGVQTVRCESDPEAEFGGRVSASFTTTPAADDTER